jgi:fucose permease
MLAIAFCCHVAGVVVTIVARGYDSLWAGALLLGLGSGLIEVTINPLIATLYRDDKTAKLNRLHSWFPGGNVIAAVLAWGMTGALEHSVSGQLLWQLKMAVILVPVVAYGVLFFGQKFPETERVQSKVSTGDMYRELLRPLFLLWICCMLLTASTELATTSWIPTILAGKSGDRQILVVAWINTIMLIGRMYAGKVVHALSPIRMLIGSAFFALIGLLALGTIHGFAPAFLGATLFAIGVCYFWPTMLGVTSERFPRGGAFLMGVIGAAGMLSVYTVIPQIGKVLDNHKDDPTFGFKVMAILPAILIIVFSAVYLHDKSRGGYKPEVLE